MFMFFFTISVVLMDGCKFSRFDIHGWMFYFLYQEESGASCVEIH